MSMDKYIDREALLQRLEASPLFGHFGEDGAFIKGFVTELIEMQPSTDVVEVVRCKDCKFWGIPHANDIEKSHYCCRDNMWCMPLRFADDYCSYGERREG